MTAARVGITMVLLFSAGCAFFGHIASGLAGADSYCDRRFGGSESPQPFCQEIIDTVAGPDFRDDCGQKLKGQAGEGRCPRDRIIGGCQIDKSNDDGSVVTDWYYDVSDLVATGKPFTQESLVHSTEEIQKKCAERSAYSDGAHYVAK